ncbi:MAG: sugar-binding protein, partial [Verrucomicrobiales bacterium]|nr:sugar-binding protein [Verrucomicrobiales bacterium]
MAIIAATCFSHFGAHANDIEPGKEFYTAIKATNPIVVDGDLSEWTGANVLADPRFSIPKGSGDDGTLVNFELHNGGDWTGPDDHTSAVRVVYDDDNVYFGFVVTDEYHENAANSAWNGDSVQLMVANEFRDSQVALYNYALGGVEGATGDVIIMHEAGPGGTEAVVTRNAATKRTVYEIKLPKESLELDELIGGTQFGLGMAINDGDEATPGQKGWGGLGAHAIVFGKTPQQTALITLATANDIEAGKEFHSAKQPPSGKIVLDGNLNDWAGVPVLSDPRFAIPKGSGSRGGGELNLFEIHNGGSWTGPDDQTSAVQVAYDTENVYFAFLVTDDYHENAANSAWNGDSVQLMIANDKQDTQVALYNYALGGVE